MLNEKVDFVTLRLIITIAGVLFLMVMWGGFYVFTRLKKKDEDKRRNFKSVIESLDSIDRPD